MPGTGTKTSSDAVAPGNDTSDHHQAIPLSAPNVADADDVDDYPRRRQRTGKSRLRVQSEEAESSSDDVPLIVKYMISKDQSTAHQVDTPGTVMRPKSVSPSLEDELLTRTETDTRRISKGVSYGRRGLPRIEEIPSDEDDGAREDAKAGGVRGKRTSQKIATVDAAARAVTDSRSKGVQRSGKRRPAPTPKRKSHVHHAVSEELIQLREWSATLRRFARTDFGTARKKTLTPLCEVMGDLEKVCTAISLDDLMDSNITSALRDICIRNEVVLPHNTAIECTAFKIYKDLWDIHAVFSDKTLERHVGRPPKGSGSAVQAVECPVPRALHRLELKDIGINLESLMRKPSFTQDDYAAFDNLLGQLKLCQDQLTLSNIKSFRIEPVLRNIARRRFATDTRYIAQKAGALTFFWDTKFADERGRLVAVQDDDDDDDFHL